jgi:pumilio RNA-binding family
MLQYIVEHGEPRDRQIIVVKFEGRMMQLSHQKHSSNVIEKLLIHGGYMDRKLVIAEILCAGGCETVDHLLVCLLRCYHPLLLFRHA